MLAGQLQRLSEKLEERCLARVTCANNKNTDAGQYIVSRDVPGLMTAYLYGVGSLRRRRRRGLLTELAALLT